MERRSHPLARADSKLQSGTEKGTALVEFTLVFPVFLLLMLNAVNFGFYIYAWVTVGNAARAAAQYQSYNGVAVGSPNAPSYSQVSSPLFADDTSSLPNTPTLTICRRNTDGSVTVWGGSGSCASIPTDPESSPYALWTVTVTYNFTQLLASSAIGIYSLPTSIQQQVVMRSMQ
jgi:Flp pilus assembly protein TadG